MKVLIYRYGSICEPDVMMAFDMLNVEHKEIDVEVTRKNVSSKETLDIVSKALDEEKFDAVFSINYYPILSAVCNIYKVRYISWTVDSPVLELNSNTLSNEWNRTFVFDRAEYEYFKEVGQNHIFHLPLAVNVNRLDKYLSKTDPNPKFGGDVALVGSLYTEKNPYERFAKKDSYLGGYLEAIMQAQSRIYGEFLLPKLVSDEQLKEFKENLPGFYTPPEDFTIDDKMTMCLLYLGSNVAVIERRRLLTMLGERYNVNLYTGSGSKGIPVKNCGLVKSLEEMPLVFRDAKINLNFTLKSIRTGIPQRVFDVLGCGGFLITNYQQEIAELLPNDLVMFGGDEELMDLTEYFLSHEKERKEIAMEGKADVTKNHTIERRMVEMFELAFSI
ncbi:MAG: DUF3880 domain-containing protein [Lachnospiraceae bacterium]|nr:DUF3880 domain-containing protein [Lachnospiraceae bacterium]